VVDDNDVKNYVNRNNIHENVIRVGFENSDKGETFDEAFYLGNGLPFSMRFDNFYLERDYELEMKIISELNPENSKYIFVHNVDKNKIRNDLKIIDNPSNYNIFNLISLIANAEEVHLMESSIKCLVNSYKMEKPTFFSHHYVRNYPRFINSIGLNEYKTIY
jgi:hypothetical protein